MTSQTNHNHTVAELAGYCSELTLWELLRDILALLKEPLAISADSIAVDCDTDESLSLAPGTPPCSEPETVWRIGIIISLLSSGREPFGGRSAEYINARRSIELPSLRREHSSLNRIVHSCLAPDPADRPSLADLVTMTDEGLAEAASRLSRRQSEVVVSPTHQSADHSAWPEEMKP